MAAAGPRLAGDARRMTEACPPVREYRPEIDGLRAVAVIPVVVFHLGLEWLRGGYLGVDVFFVISGFLITSIVLSDLRSDRFTFREFWARRIRRILPPLIVMVGCTLLAALVLMPTFDHASIGRQAVAALLSLANIHFWRAAGDYWGLQAEQMPLLHTWSLSVEEQFYLLFPLAIWAVYRWRRSWLTSAPVLLAAGSFALFLYGLGRSPTATFYLLPTRAWELAVGCALATASRPAAPDPVATPTWRSWLAVLGLGMILATYFLLPDMNAGAAVTVLGAALVLAFGGAGPCRAILSLPPLVAVGKASYSLYLWHWPFLVFAGHPNVEGNAWLACGLSCVAAVLSCEWIERTTRRRAGILPVIGGCYLAVLAAAVVMTFSKGEYDTSAFNRPSTHAYCYNLGDVTGEDYRKTVARTAGTHVLPEPTFAADAFREGGIIVPGASTTPRVVVLGDSHGTSWSHVIRRAVTNLHLTTAFYSAIGVSPFLKPAPRIPETAGAGFDASVFQACRMAFIERWRPDVVIVSARWSKYRYEDAAALIGFLTGHSGRVLLIEQPPELAITDRDPMQWLAFKGVVPAEGRRAYLRPGNLKRYEQGRALIRRLAQEFPRSEVVPVRDLYEQDSRVLVLDGRNVLYLDEDHLTDFGVELAADRIEGAIAGALSPSTEGGPALEAAPGSEPANLGPAGRQRPGFPPAVEDWTKRKN
ncbi:MAG: acyltransferase [Planctomycetia bacterium]|nr:acyltransferase [Planctomycetia bacterium]